jgi:uncharacterized protein YggU (UPF0235/DUF167 family)
VTAPPAENRANDALLLLAREWRLKRRDLSIAGGAKSRNKPVLIAGDPAALMARLTTLVPKNSPNRLPFAPPRPSSV